MPGLTFDELCSIWSRQPRHFLQRALCQEHFGKQLHAFQNMTLYRALAYSQARRDLLLGDFVNASEPNYVATLRRQLIKRAREPLQLLSSIEPPFRRHLV